MTEELKPCPFCGSKPELNHDWELDFWYVECYGCWTAQDAFYGNPELAIACWNERAEKTCYVVSHNVFCGSFGCEEAGEEWHLSCGHVALNDCDYPPNHCPECGARVVYDA